MTRSAPLVIVLCVQAGLLFYDLSLLPIWTDELFTVTTVAHPVREIVPIVQRDIHPPLYYALLHEWGKLPLPWAGVAALRAFSCLWALLATFLLDLFWARELKPWVRWLALWLFALSPCLLLYGRMARSYPMQATLTLLSVGMLLRWMRAPRSVWLGLAALGSVLSLLYTHYVPGLAVLAGFVLTGWQAVGVARLAAFSSAVLLGYLPWLNTLSHALLRWGHGNNFTGAYAISGNAFLEHFIKIGYGLVSLSIGESFLAISLLLVPVIVLFAAAGVRTSEFSRQLFALIAIAAVIGYLGVSRWASYPFIPARLLWLLPFLCLAVTLGISNVNRFVVRSGVVAVILLSYISSMFVYFSRRDYLNPGYAAPLPEIAATLNREAQPADLILMDAYNTDSQVLSTLLSGRTPYIVLENDDSVSKARQDVSSASAVWIARNTRDISPGRITTKIQSEACAGRNERDTLLEPYAAWQRAAMKILGMQPLTHFYQLTRCGPSLRLPKGRVLRVD